MSISTKIDNITTSRNAIRAKMVAAGQASTTDKLSTLASNLSILDTSDTDTLLTSFDLEPGFYLFSVIASISKTTEDFDISLSVHNVDGFSPSRYNVANGRSPMARSGGVNLVTVFSSPFKQKYYIYAKHNSTSNVMIYPGITIVKLK